MSLHALLQFILKLIVYLNGNEKYYCFLQESAMKRRVNLKYSMRRHIIDRHSEFCDTTRQWVLIKFSEWMWTNLHPGERVEWWDKYPGIHPFHFQHFLCLRLKKSLWRNSLTDILMVCLPSILTLENISIFYIISFEFLISIGMKLPFSFFLDSPNQYNIHKLYAATCHCADQ